MQSLTVAAMTAMRAALMVAMVMIKMK